MSTEGGRVSLPGRGVKLRTWVDPPLGSWILLLGGLDPPLGRWVLLLGGADPPYDGSWVLL